MNPPSSPPLPIGRFAPSPTGALHRGSLVAAIGSYLSAKARGGRWLVRMEDLDTPRLIPGAADTILRDLERLGLEWDGPVLYQSTRLDAYESALATLRERGLVFPCACSRRELEEHGGRYPGTCRAGLPEDRASRSLRMRTDDRKLRFLDMLHGPQIQNPAEAGDFVVRRADGYHAYVLACVVDDAYQEVDQVVRGADLLPITGRQCLLQDGLGLPRTTYAHLPLILNPDGSKLSKSRSADNWGNDASLAWQRALQDLGIPLPRDLRDAPLDHLRAHALIAWQDYMRCRASTFASL